MPSQDNETGLPALYSGAQVAAFDRHLIEVDGISGFTLMQHAAATGWQVLQARWPQPGRLAVFCGPGNNGGDGYLIAALALQAGWSVDLVAMGRDGDPHSDAGRARSAFESAGGRVSAFDDTAIRADVIVDGLLGTGLGRDVEGRFARAVARINAAHEQGAGVLAVDMPSGIDATTGRRWKTAVQADVTATFIGRKVGLYTGAGSACAGTVIFEDLQAPPELYANTTPVAVMMTDTLRHDSLQPRARDAHKGANGRVLCVGGNRGMGGAARMAGEAALRTGAGLVSVCCHPDHAGAMSQARPELMCQPVTADMALPVPSGTTVLAVGPGLGRDDWAQQLFQQAVTRDTPLVVDADALNLLAMQPQDRGNWILTPHPGEAARLLGGDVVDIDNDRPAAARALAEQYNAVVVLKGAGSLVATTRAMWLCPACNPGMATGGMGDVLTGIIAGLVSQGLSLERAARLGVWIHARAGDSVAAQRGERGMLATDLLAALAEQVNP